MIKKIDVESEEFQIQFELTQQFTEKVCEEHGLVYNPEADVNESIQMGLTRNKMIYGTRFCPCFMVIGQTKEEQVSNKENRLCPCIPALEKEIPSQGHCHCAIFCTPEFVKSQEEKVTIVEEQTHSKGLKKEECEQFLTKAQVNASEIEALLEARELGFVDFLLVDTREWMEWVGARIKGTDFLVPTTSFYQSLDQIEDKKDVPVILYCHSGSRSAYCQRIMLSNGYKTVINFDYGIMTYQGELESGE